MILSQNFQNKKYMIKTKSIYAPKTRGDGLRILITRYYPRGIKKTHFDKWVRDLAPTKELLKEYKDEKIDWESFQTNFKKQMKDSESKNTIESLAKISNNKNITLLCYEKDDEHCHRHIVQKLITNTL